MESYDRVSIDHIEFIPHHKRFTHSPDPVVESSTTRSMTVGTFQTRNPHQTISGIVTHKPQDLAKLRKSGSCASFGFLDTILFVILIAHRHRAPTQTNDEQVGAVHQNLGVSTN